MDINGAKALKKRLSLNPGEAAPARADVDIADDAVAVFHRLGVAQATPETPIAEDDPATSGTTLFRRRLQLPLAPEPLRSAGRQFRRIAQFSSGRADGLTSMKPPSTRKDAPVVQRASGEHSQAMQLAISRASPGRGIGNCGFGCCDGSSSSSPVIGVATIPGRDGVDRDPAPAELQGELLRQPAEPVLRHGVRAAVRDRRVLVDGRYVDDSAAAALLDHASRRALRAREGAVEVDRERVPPVVVGELEQLALPTHARLFTSTSRPPSARRGRRSRRRRREVGEVELPHLRVVAVAMHLAAVSCAPCSSSCHVAPTSKPSAERRTAVARPIPESEPVTIATGIRRAFPFPRVPIRPGLHRRPMEPRQRRDCRPSCERGTAEGAGHGRQRRQRAEERLGKNGADKAPPAAEPADVPADALPVYHWTGKKPPETAPAEADDDSAPRRAALFSRLSLSFR